MSNSKLVDINFEEIVEIFNKGGKPAASEFAKNKYGVEYYLVARRIKAETSYEYNKKSRKYELQDSIENKVINNRIMKELESVPDVKESDVMPEIKTKNEILGEGKSQISTLSGREQRCISFQAPSLNDIMVDLMKDWIMEISKYIHLEQSSKKIIISMTYLKEAGYDIVEN